MTDAHGTVDTNLFGGPWSSVVEQLLSISALLSYPEDLNVVLGQHHLKTNQGAWYRVCVRVREYGYVSKGMCVRVSSVVRTSFIP